LFLEIPFNISPGDAVGRSVCAPAWVVTVSIFGYPGDDLERAVRPCGELAEAQGYGLAVSVDLESFEF
jgi:hypothetical protein